MSGRLIVGAGLMLIGSIALNVVAGHVSADEGGTATGGSDSDAGEITAVAGRETAGGQGVSHSGPACTYTPFDTVWSQVPGATSGIVRRDASTKETLPPGTPAGQNTETMYVRRCPGREPVYVWVPDGVDVEDLVASAREEVSDQLPVPVLEMSPDPSVGGTVNIGLWLALEDPGDVSVTASVGPVWATVTARFVQTSWSMGNGDVVECDGLGTPILDAATVEQGPCGYTYRWPSAPQFTGSDALAYRVSVTGHWVVSYATSTGAGGSLPGLDRSTEFDYSVRELQSVRVADG